MAAATGSSARSLRPESGPGTDAPWFQGGGVVFLKYGGGIFENIPEKCGIFVICRYINYHQPHFIRPLLARE